MTRTTSSLNNILRIYQEKHEIYVKTFIKNN
jgi:hypothetical protein